MGTTPIPDEAALVPLGDRGTNRVRLEGYPAAAMRGSLSWQLGHRDESAVHPSLPSQSTRSLSVAGLFAGIGGLEHGLSLVGHRTEYLCEIWEPAREVLRAHFPEVAGDTDVVRLQSLPPVDVLTAGFPCTDLSQAGRTAGILGLQSGLVSEVLRLLSAEKSRRRPTWVVIENVRNMLPLAGGAAMQFVVQGLEDLGYRWAYRVVDSRSVGVPQRRQRVFLVASRDEDPRGVLFADEAGEPAEGEFRSDAFGFYWTEGLRGLGWAHDAVPTLKGGSTIGIPSPPAIWAPGARLGRRVVLPGIEDAEALQGFPRGWTAAVDGNRSVGTRWKLVGNAVTVGVAAWLGGRLGDPGEANLEETPLKDGARWPLAAWGERGRRFAVQASLWPVRRPYVHLTDLVALERAVPLSERATLGFARRLRLGGLKVAPREFHQDVVEHAGLYRASA
ncbi:MAG: DNA cytosine methyltransferase [Candidatus Dormibacteria bacterium]